jgi:hypothetical protein
MYATRTLRMSRRLHKIAFSYNSPTHFNYFRTPAFEKRNKLFKDEMKTGLILVAQAFST